MKYFFSVLLFVIPFLLQGQEIKVNVVFKNEPLPYTYISVNRTPIAITNASGIARIPMDKINFGDTITSSMIGMLSVSIIYDQQIQQHQECELVHTTEVAYDLGEVTAIGYSDRSSRRIFSRVATTHVLLQQNHFVNGKFTYIITLPDGTTHPVTGSFVLENHIPRGKRTPLYFFNIPPHIGTKNDTTNLSEELITLIRYIYRGACAIIFQLRYEQGRQTNYSNMSYLGLREGQHFFNYGQSSPESMETIQILIEVDADSQEMINAKYTYTALRDGFPNHFIRMPCQQLNLNFSYQKVSVPPRGRNIRAAPKDIEATVIKHDGSKIELKLDDISIQFQ